MNIADSLAAIKAMDVRSFHPIEDCTRLCETCPVLKMVRFFASVVRYSVNSDDRINVKDENGIGFRKAARVHFAAYRSDISTSGTLISNRRVVVTIKNDDPALVKIGLNHRRYMFGSVVDESA